MNILSVFLYVSCLLNGYLAINTFRHRKTPGAVTFGLTLISIIFYSLGYAFEIHSGTLPEILFWLRVEYIGISFFPTLLIVFLLQILGKEVWLKRWLLVLMCSISATTLLIHYTTLFNHWFYDSISTNTYRNLVLIQTTKGFWYWVHQGYSCVSMGLFTSWFLARYLQEDNLKRRQSLLMVLSSIAPWICYIIYIKGLSPKGIDLIPFSFSVMAFIIAFGMYRYKLFELTPLALAKIFQYLKDGVIVIDQESRILQFNNAAEGIFKNLNQDIIGKNILTLEDSCPALADLIQKEDFLEHDVEVISEESVKIFEVKVSIVCSKNLYPLGKILNFREITERKQAEMLLVSDQERLKKLNQTKNRIFSIIGHDLRGTVGMINTTSAILFKMADNLSYPDKKSLLKTLMVSSQESLKLLENMLTWAKGQIDGIKSFPTEFFLKDLIKDSIEILRTAASEKDITIHMEVPHSLKAHADVQMLSLVVRNLVSNAIKFTYRNGEISISAVTSNGEIQVRVKDNGIGIPEEYRLNMFKIDQNIRRNGTESETGTGLGLLLCKEFIDHHHGRICVEESSASGTTFLFTLPEREFPSTSAMTTAGINSYL